MIRDQQTPGEKEDALVNLGVIAKQSKSHKSHLRASTFAVIIDSTRPYKSHTANDYVTKLKLIDESYNPKMTEGGFKKHKKFYNLFVYTHNIEDAPDVSNIGDIIRLSKVEFKRFSGSGVVEMQGKIANLDKVANWGVYMGRDKEDMSPLSSRRGGESELKVADKKRLIELRGWAKTFFLTHSRKQSRRSPFHNLVHLGKQ